MKVLTIKQPFASLIIKGYKEYEFRTWATKYRGELLIHAGKSIDKEALEKRFKNYDLGDMPTGAIIGKVNITDCIKMDNNFANELNSKDKNVYYSGLSHFDGYAWKIEDVVEFKERLFTKGKLSLWNYNI